MSRTAAFEPWLSLAAKQLRRNPYEGGGGRLFFVDTLASIEN